MILDDEIIESFKEEANGIISELELIVEKLEESEDVFPRSDLEEFANKTDRIMGTANTFYSQYPDHKIFDVIGTLGGLCKATGYKASTLNHIPLIPVFAAFWGDTIEIMTELINNIDEPEKINSIMQDSAPILQKRLMWLAEQILKINKAMGIEEKAVINVDGLLRKLGIEV